MTHRAGNIVIARTVVFFLAISSVTYLLTERIKLTLVVATVLLLLVLFVIRFFRKPKREVTFDEGQVLSPADGHIVAIEKVVEDEFLNKEALQVSVFMSVWNVHINWFPAKGSMKKYKYHPGKFLLARHPKSSTLNERTSVLMETSAGVPVVVRQIAGIVARRIENYVQKEDTTVEAGQEMGFIKFGSRVDVFLPLDAKIHVKLGDKVRGQHTILAQINS
ncbi:MAG: phosphatidylserine decarboxylase family protein [Salinivirgaceae bacterium]|jgi:phosphatidylserine decarboxylase|nr:phosphatidylserine decarboxylase family protein [Salinivirgaceae bacterium]